ncbi:MAG: zinc ribbon domain-containing protein [Gemmatimonadota bacterium]
MQTDPGSNAAVGRLFGALREAIDRRPEGSPPTITVSEIYQTLVPYARARASLGFEMNADYEHALMQMLAGEGGHARLDPPEARDQVARELETPNPDVTLYRRFAACSVWISESTEPIAAGPASPPGGTDWGRALERANETPARAPESSVEATLVDGLARLSSVLHGHGGDAQPAADPSGEGGLESAIAAPAEGQEAPAESIDDGPAQGERENFADAAASTIPTSPEPGDATTDAAGLCGSCGMDFPADRDVRYCPYCGSEQPRVCDGCGDSLEQDWRFCPSCGTGT